MKGKSIFTATEASLIKKLIQQKLVSSREVQKRVRDEIRGIGFYIMAQTVLEC